MDRKIANEMVQKLATELAEYFDAVQVMVSWVDEGSTCAISKGSGNFYARIGLAREFVMLDAAKEQAIEIAQQLNPEN